jgi:hypothetical protein
VATVRPTVISIKLQRRRDERLPKPFHLFCSVRLM